MQVAFHKNTEYHPIETRSLDAFFLKLFHALPDVLRTFLLRLFTCLITMLQPPQENFVFPIPCFKPGLKGGKHYISPDLLRRPKVVLFAAVWAEIT
jgi:hypothetical protein